MNERLKSALKMAAVTVVSIAVFDIGGAQIAKRVLPEWKNARAEKAARIQHPVYHHGIAPKARYIHAFGDAGGVPYVSNSLGFRDSEPRDVPLDGGRPRIVIIGDSFTEGLGVPFDATYAGLLAQAGTERGVSVLNAGVTSYAPSVYDRKLRYLAEDVGLRFDHAVVFLDLSDIEDEADCYRRTADDRIEMACGRDYSTTKRFKLWLKDHSIVYRAYRSWRDAQPEAEKRAREGRIGSVTGIERVRWTIDDAVFERFGRRGLAQATDAMARLAGFLDDRGIRLTIVVYPWPDQLLASDRDSRQVRHWRRFCADHGCDFINAFPPLFEAGAAEEVILSHFLAYDFHFNAQGHAVIAETVSQALAWPGAAAN